MPDTLPNTGDLIRPAAAARAPLALPSSRSSVPAAKPSKQSLALAILRGLARRWKIAILLGAMLATAIGTAAWYLIPPPQPTAAAKLYIPQKPWWFDKEHPDPPLERSTQIEWLRSHMILTAAIRDPDIANLPLLKAEADPLDWLSKKLVIEFLGPEILRVSLTSNEPEQAKLIVNAIVKAYLVRIADKSSTDRAERLRRLKEYTGDLARALAQQRAQIQSLSKNSGAFESEKRQFFRERLQRSIEAADRQLTRAQALLKTARAKEKALLAESTAVPDSEIDSLVDADPTVQASAARLKEQRGVIASLDLTLKKDGPGQKLLADAEAELEKLNKGDEQLRTRVRGIVRKAAQEKANADHAQKLAKVREEIAYLHEEVNFYQNEIETYAKTLSDFRLDEGELAPLRFEMAQTERLLSGGLQAKQQLEIEQDAPSRVELMESATISSVDAEKRKKMATAGGGAAGFLLAIVLVGLIEARFRRVESVDAVSEQLGLRVVGTVPTPKGGPFKWLTNNDARTQAMLTEAIACTRTMLLHGEGSSAHRVLLITSPTSGEGKTSLAVQLGVSISLAGHKTLLIDADLRNPSAHERFGMPHRPGLCELLRGEVSLLEVIRETPVPGMDMIPGGQWTPDTAQALVTAPLSQLFAMWREQYEFVILDSSPVLPVTDALLLARHVDGVILSLLQGVSRMTQAAEVCERFTSLGVNVIGAIVNGTSARAYGGTDKYYYPTPATVSAPASPTEQA